MAEWTEQQRTDAMEVYREHGLATAHHRSGVPKSTLRDWLVADGGDPAEVAARTCTKTTAATAAYLAGVDARLAREASGLIEDIGLLREQLFSPCVERKVVTLAGTKDLPGSWELVDIERAQPTFAEQTRIMTSIGIAVDKVQLLTGGATERVESTGDARARVERALHALDELAARREAKAG